jgi:VWFA-related protein
MRFWLWLITLQVLTAQDVPRFESAVSWVRVDVEVMNHGTPVEKLGLNHFRILDNGQEQKLLRVVQEDEPLDVLLLFDTSGSMQHAVQRAAAGARKALEALAPNDRVAVMTFNTRTHLFSAFQSDLDSTRVTVEEGVLKESFGGWTYIWDAVYTASDFQMRYSKRGSRRAIVIVTDNYGQKKDRDEQTTLTSLWESDTVLAGVIVPNPAEARKAKDPIGINHLAEETGGEALSADDAGAGLIETMNRLRHRYSIYYSMPAGEPGERRTVRVELQGVAKELYPDARIFARKGYFLPEKQPAHEVSAPTTQSDPVKPN